MNEERETRRMVERKTCDEKCHRSRQDDPRGEHTGQQGDVKVETTAVDTPDSATSTINQGSVHQLDCAQVNQFLPIFANYTFTFFLHIL